MLGLLLTGIALTRQVLAANVEHWSVLPFGQISLKWLTIIHPYSGGISRTLQQIRTACLTDELLE